ncbi:MAG: NirD/YgiW/YdeI family stress tolerance protein [Spongiibacteraceae bacterium]|jgi:uncharacterized protein (TIGR00156 family)|nr:NirD/YgiW/YdeI family stress tolerance protein [Spongiibacteraceae bacterium]
MSFMKTLKVIGGAVAASAVVACSSPQPSMMNISQVLLEPDGREVVINAQVIQRLDEGRFLVADPTGQINVEVDRELLGEIEVLPGTNLRVVGEVDRDSAGTELDAERVQILP